MDVTVSMRSEVVHKCNLARIYDSLNDYYELDV